MGYFLGGITLTCFLISSCYVVCALSVFSFKKSSMKEEYKSNFIIGIIGKTYSPDSSKVIVYQGKRDPGGSASVRNEEKDGRNKKLSTKSLGGTSLFSHQRLRSNDSPINTEILKSLLINIALIELLQFCAKAPVRSRQCPTGLSGNSALQKRENQHNRRTGSMAEMFKEAQYSTNFL